MEEKRNGRSNADYLACSIIKKILKRLEAGGHKEFHQYLSYSDLLNYCRNKVQ